MTTETAAVAAVVEAKIATEDANNEAQAATVAAVTAEDAAVEAVQAAKVVKEMAERETQVAVLSAEQRIAGFEGEVIKCRAEIESLQATLREMTASHQSIQVALSELSWLREVEATMSEEEKEELRARASGKSSGTGGSTSDGDDGKTSKPEKSSGEEKPPAVEPEEKGEPASKSAEPKAEAKAEEKAARHRWL